MTTDDTHDEAKRARIARIRTALIGTARVGVESGKHRGDDFAEAMIEAGAALMAADIGISDTVARLIKTADALEANGMPAGLLN